MTEPTPEKDRLTEEFANLGKNLVGVLQAAWESPERKRLQEELLNGLNNFGESIKHEAATFNDSPTGKQIKVEVEELGDRLRSGEAQEKVRQELLGILRTANDELTRVMNQWSPRKSDETTPASPTEPPTGV